MLNIPDGVTGIFVCIYECMYIYSYKYVFINTGNYTYIQTLLKIKNKLMRIMSLKTNFFP